MKKQKRTPKDAHRAKAKSRSQARRNARKGKQVLRDLSVRSE